MLLSVRHVDSHAAWRAQRLRIDFYPGRYARRRYPQAAADAVTEAIAQERFPSFPPRSAHLLRRKADDDDRWIRNASPIRTIGVVPPNR